MNTCIISFKLETLGLWGRHLGSTLIERRLFTASHMVFLTQLLQKFNTGVWKIIVSAVLHFERLHCLWNGWFITSNHFFYLNQNVKCHVCVFLIGLSGSCIGFTRNDVKFEIFAYYLLNICKCKSNWPLRRDDGLWCRVSWFAAAVSQVIKHTDCSRYWKTFSSVTPDISLFLCKR